MNNHPDGLDALGPAALRTYFRIAEAWQLTDAEQKRLLGDPSPSTLLSWRNHDSAPDVETLHRVSRIFSIYRALQVLFPSPAQADAWVRQPNAAADFGGRSALDVMLSCDSNGLQFVQRHLNAQLHG